MARVDSVDFREVLVVCLALGATGETVVVAGLVGSSAAPGAMVAPAAASTVTVAMVETAAMAGSSAAPEVMEAPRADQAARMATVATAATAALSVGLEDCPVALPVAAVTVETVAWWEVRACVAALAAKGA